MKQNEPKRDILQATFFSESDISKKNYFVIWRFVNFLIRNPTNCKTFNSKSDTL